MKRTRYGDNLSGFMTLLQPTSSSQSSDNDSESGAGSGAEPESEPDSDSKDSQQGGSSKKQSDLESADDQVLSCILDIF